MLKLSGNSLGTSGLVLILEGLAKNMGLRHLDISSNNGGPEVCSDSKEFTFKLSRQLLMCPYINSCGGPEVCSKTRT